METAATIQNLLGLLAGADSASGVVLALAATRLLGVLSAVPAFSSRILAFRLRAATAGVIVASLVASAPAWTPLWSSADASAVRLSSAAGGLPLAFASELAIGLCLGWGAFLVLGAVRAAAVFISEQIGFSFGGVMDPLAESDETALRTFHGMLGAFLFVGLDLHHDVLRLAVESFDRLPPGQLVASGDWRGAAELLVATGGTLFEAVLTLAVPVTILLGLVAVAQGVLSRALPELELFALGFPLRVLLGVGVTAVALPYTTRTVGAWMEEAIRDGESLFGVWVG